MQPITLEFPNGDRILFGKSNVIYYRRKLITPDSFGWDNTILTADSGVYPGPMQYAIKAALETVRKLEQESGTQPHFIPKFLSNQIPKPAAKVRCIEKGQCQTTGQSIERVVAEEDLVFPHPLHPGNEDRVFRVKAGDESGWIPHGLAQGGDVWVDRTSFLSGTARYGLVTKRSRVVGSSIFGSWIRDSTVDLSTVLNSVVQQSTIIDTHAENSGIRASSVRNAYTKGCSFNHSTAAVCNLTDIRLNQSALNVSVLSKVSGDSLKANSSHLINVLVDNCSVIASFVENARLVEGKTFSSKLGSKDQMIELKQFIRIHGNEIDARVDDPSNIKVV